MDNSEVLVFGSINIDKVYTVPHFVAPGESLFSEKVEVFAGGKGLNQAVALARAGVKTAMAGKIGEDGEWLAETLRRAGVDTGNIMRGSVPTTHSCVQVVAATGQNSIVIARGANHDIGKSEMIGVLDKQPPGTTLLLQNEINDIPFLISEAAKRRLPVAINPAPCTPEVAEYPLELVKVLIVNEVEAAQLAGRQAPYPELAHELSARYPNSEVIVTLGGAGALYAHRGREFHTPAPHTKVVDSTGAGDTFTGYYLAAKLRGMPPEQAMELACKAGAISVSRAGAAPSIPEAREVFED